MGRGSAHTDLVKAIRLALGHIPECDFEPLHQTKSGHDDAGNYIPPGGMCVGAADLIGTVCGRRVDIEVKTGKARQTPEQKQWQVRIRRVGGVCEVARSVQDALAIVRVVILRELVVDPDTVRQIRNSRHEMKRCR